MQKIRLLIADDHHAFREGLARLLIDQDDMEVIEFLVEVTDEMVTEVDATVARVTRYFNEGKLPPRLPRSNGKKAWMCGFCDWSTHCWDIDPEGEELS